MKEKNVFNCEVGERIARLRTIRKLSREKLAAKAEITDRFLYDIESGRKGCSAEVLYQLAQALEVSADLLLTGKMAQNQSIRGDLMVLISQLPEDSLPYVQTMIESFGDYARGKK